MSENHEEDYDEDEDYAAQELHDDLFEVFEDHGEVLFMLCNSQHLLLFVKMQKLELIQRFRPNVETTALMAADVKMCSLVIKMLKEKKGDYLSKNGSEIAMLFAKNPEYREKIRDMFCNYCYQKLNGGIGNGARLIIRIRKLCDGIEVDENELRNIPDDEPDLEMTSTPVRESVKRSHPSNLIPSAVELKKRRNSKIIPARGDYYTSPMHLPLPVNNRIGAAALVSTVVREERKTEQTEEEDNDFAYGKAISLKETPAFVLKKGVNVTKMLQDFNFHDGTHERVAQQIITITELMCGGKQQVHQDLLILHRTVYRSNVFINMQSLKLPGIYATSVDVLSLLAVDYTICVSVVKLIREKEFLFSNCGGRIAKLFIENLEKRNELRRVFARYCNMKVMTRKGTNLDALMGVIHEICGTEKKERRLKKVPSEEPEIRQTVVAEKREPEVEEYEEFIEIEGDYDWTTVGQVIEVEDEKPAYLEEEEKIEV